MSLACVVFLVSEAPTPDGNVTVAAPFIKRRGDARVIEMGCPSSRRHCACEDIRCDPRAWMTIPAVSHKSAIQHNLVIELQAFPYWLHCGQYRGFDNHLGLCPIDKKTSQNGP